MIQVVGVDGRCEQEVLLEVVACSGWMIMEKGFCNSVGPNRPLEIRYFLRALG